MDKLKLAALGERLKTGGERLKSGGAEVGRRVGEKMKEILQGQSPEAKMVDEATSDSLEEPNWGLNLRICGMLNSDEFNGSEVVKAIKKKIASRNAVSQRLSLDLLEACAMNCDKIFSEVASEKVLDEMVRMIDNPQTNHGNRMRALQLIEAWGESEDLAYLPIFRQTYMSLKGRKMQASAQHDDNSSSLLSSGEQNFAHVAAPPDRYPYPNVDQPNTDLGDLIFHGGGLSAEEKKEILVVARNSIEILSSILNSETKERPLENDLTISMLEKCKESQPMIQRIIESTGDDEAMLFEALNLHDELQQILAKYEELKIANLPETGDTVKESGPSAGLMRDDEAKEQQTPKESESTSQSRDSEKVE
ncbi:target of Myb protein 1-like [Ananas comosus]|uniref:Target of Myb protein 1-like n=1 Tax=Ananas comosus TaxID=4615 RepID=A0A6P5H766_ANACO|nr:target of Myb protein 1-like [Ananas comosus]